MEDARENTTVGRWTEKPISDLGEHFARIEDIYVEGQCEQAIDA